MIIWREFKTVVDLQIVKCDKRECMLSNSVIQFQKLLIKFYYLFLCVFLQIQFRPLFNLPWSHRERFIDHDTVSFNDE
jgi:hypothetical protein